MPFHPKSRTRFVLVLLAGIILLAGLFTVGLISFAPDAASARGPLLLTVFIIILVVTVLSIILILRWVLRPYRQLVGEAERAPVSVRSFEMPRDEGQFVLETFKSVVAQLQAQQRELETLSAQASARAASAEKFSERIVASVPSGLIAFDAQARAKSEGYSLVQWVGSTPQRWLDDVAYLTGRMSTDAPLDALQWDAEVYDAARMQADETSSLACGLHMVTTAAVHSTGQLVGLTQIVGLATSTWFAGQWNTIVAPEHRGHRLGMLIKVANLRHALAQRPELRVIDTCNANSNRHMIVINEVMGFRPHRRMAEWQLDL